MGPEQLYLYYRDRCNPLCEPAAILPLNHRINSSCSGFTITSDLQTASLPTCLIAGDTVSWPELVNICPTLWIWFLFKMKTLAFYFICITPSLGTCVFHILDVLCQSLTSGLQCVWFRRKPGAYTWIPVELEKEKTLGWRLHWFLMQVKVSSRIFKKSVFLQVTPSP